MSFWLISVPFLSNHGLKAAIAQTLILVAANAIYVARAITEERHLARDPVYRAYQEFIRREGLLARLLRLLGVRPFVVRAGLNQSMAGDRVSSSPQQSL